MQLASHDLYSRRNPGNIYHPQSGKSYVLGQLSWQVTEGEHNGVDLSQRCMPHRTHQLANTAGHFVPALRNRAPSEDCFITTTSHLRRNLRELRIYSLADCSVKSASLDGQSRGTSHAHPFSACSQLRADSVDLWRPLRGFHVVSHSLPNHPTAKPYSRPRSPNSREEPHDYLWLTQDLWMEPDVWAWATRHPDVKEAALKRCGYAECSNREEAVFTFKCCGGCKEEWNCSPECRKADWQKHKLECFGYRQKLLAGSSRDDDFGSESSSSVSDDGYSDSSSDSLAEYAY